MKHCPNNICISVGVVFKHFIHHICFDKSLHW